MQYFRLSTGAEAADTWFPGRVMAGDTEVDPRKFKDCTWYAGPNPRLETEVAAPTALSFIFGPFDMPVVDRHVAETLREVAGRDVQLVETTSDFGANYFVLNALRCIDCIDEDRTVADRWPADSKRQDKVGQYRSIYELRIDDSRAEDAAVFRPTGWRTALIVSNDVVRGLASGQLRGTRVVPVN